MYIFIYLCQTGLCGRGWERGREEGSIVHDVVELCFAEIDRHQTLQAERTVVTFCVELLI